MDKVYMLTPNGTCKGLKINGDVWIKIRLKRGDIWYCRRENNIVTVYSGIVEILFGSMDEVLQHFEVVGEI